MSITISIKSQNIERDVVIPVEWKDITVKYWGELSSIIKKHYDASSANKKADNDKAHELLKEYDMESLLSNTKLNMSETMKMNSDIFSYMTGLSKEDMESVDVGQVEQVLSTINALTEEYKPVGTHSFELD